MTVISSDDELMDDNRLYWIVSYHHGKFEVRHRSIHIKSGHPLIFENEKTAREFVEYWESFLPLTHDGNYPTLQQ